MFQKGYRKLKYEPTSKQTHNELKVKVKFRICCSASYMRQTLNQKRFTILEGTADCHELMIAHCSMRPSIVRQN